MKALSLYVAIFALILLLVPMIALNFELESPPQVQPPVDTPGISQSQDAADEPAEGPDGDEPDQQAQNEWDAEPTGDAEALLPEDEPAGEPVVDTFLILDESSGELLEVGVRDFVRGAVAAEMPVSFHLEALKAQAVAAHTYALHNHRQQAAEPDPELKGADFSADPGARKVFITEEQAREFYGERADAAWKKICQAADSVLDEVLEYEGEPIVAAYHAISAGQTEDAANVWSGSAPYLRPAESAGDLLAPDYESEVDLSAAAVREQLTVAYPEITLGDDPVNWFGEPQRSSSGYVTEIAVGDSLLHGKDIRQLFDLRSHNFDIQYTDAGFAFITYGYGHGVGLSQYGADFLARQGDTYDAILANYYEGATLVEVAVPQE